MPAKYEQYSLKEFFELNAAGKLVLPNFQREFVWDLEKQKKLLSSFICQLPVGSLLLLVGNKDDFYSKNLCYTGDPTNQADECKYLLDGQQRLSSLSSFFSNLFESADAYEERHDSLYSALRNRWFLRLEPKEKEIDIFGWNTLIFSEDTIFKYEPNDLVDFISAHKVYKNKKQEWWHPAFSPKDDTGNLLSPARRREVVADAAANAGLLPLWEFYDDPERGVHELVLRKIGERRRHVIEANIETGNKTYYEVLGHLDQDIEDKIKNKEDVEEVWIELRTNWKKEIITCIKNSFTLQEIPSILLPAEEVGRAVATFSAVNEGGTRLDPYDLIVARAAKSTKERSLTSRVVELLKKDIDKLDSVFFRNTGMQPNTWSCEIFGVLDDNVPTSVFKNIFLNSLSIYNHCYVNKREPKVEHIKIKGQLELSHREINENTENCVNAIKKALSFLCFRCGMRSINDLNYRLMILPVVYCFFDENTFNNKIKLNKIEYWFWLSIFSGRYREYQNEVCVEDIEKLRKFIDGNGDFLCDEYRLLNYEGYSDEGTLLLESREAVHGAVYDGIMCYILSLQPRDFLLNYRICSWDLVKEEEIEVDGVKVKNEINDHHIMPLAGMANVNESTTKLRNDKSCILNSPLNRTYINAATNRSLGTKTLSDYLPIIQASASFHHCIPAEDFSCKQSGDTEAEFYKRFLKARYAKFKATLKEELDNLKG